MLIINCCLKQEMELASGATLVGDGEMLDEMVTRSRGEVKHVSSPKITSSTTATPTREVRGIHSPHMSAYSPRLNQLRNASCSPRTAEIRPSKLGKSPGPPTTDSASSK